MKFCAYRASKAQQQMIEDGLPPSLARDLNAPRAHKLETKTMTTTTINDAKAAAPKPAIKAKAQPAAPAVSTKTAKPKKPVAPTPAAIGQAAATSEQKPKAAKPSAPKVAKTKNAGKAKAATARAKTIAAKPAKKHAPKVAKKVGRAPVPGQAVADFISRKGGASMAELVKEFGIEAHPMRSKIFYARHTLGYDVVTKDGRYHGTPPKSGK